MKNEKIIKPIILLTLLAIIACFCTKFYLDYKHDKDVQRQEMLETKYELQSFAFCIEESKCYKDFSYVDVNFLRLCLSAYKYYQPEAPEVTIDDIREYLSNEYDEKKEPRVLNQPYNIQEYIVWYSLRGGCNQYLDYSIFIENYIKDHEEYQNIDKYNTDMETLNKLIDAFETCPDKERYTY